MIAAPCSAFQHSSLPPNRHRFCSTHTTMGACSSKPKTVEYDDKPHDLLSFDSNKEQKQQQQASLPQEGKVPISSTHQTFPKKELAQEEKSLGAPNDSAQDQEHEQVRKQAQAPELPAQGPIPQGVISGPTGDLGQATEVAGDAEVDTPRLMEKMGGGSDDPEVAVSEVDDGKMRSEEARKNVSQEEAAVAFKNSEQAEVLPPYQVKGEDVQGGHALDTEGGKLVAASGGISHAQPPPQLQSVQEEHSVNERNSFIEPSSVKNSIVTTAYELLSSMQEDTIVEQDIRIAETKGDSLLPSHSTAELSNGERSVDTRAEGTNGRSLELNATDFVPVIALSGKDIETTRREPTRNGTQLAESMNHPAKPSISDRVASQVIAPKENGKMEESNSAIESSPDIDQVLEKLASEFERQESLSSSKS